MNRLRVLALALGTFAPLAAADPGREPPKRRFDLQGHRGTRGLAPENTRVAFARALSLGVTTLELDTVVTRDGVVVVSHDAALNPDLTRGPDGKWLEAPGPLILTLTRASSERRAGAAGRRARAISRRKRSRRPIAWACGSSPGP